MAGKEDRTDHSVYRTLQWGRKAVSPDVIGDR